MRLGIAAGIAPVPRALRRALDLLNESAVAVLSLEHGGPAERGGVLPEDLIVAINSRLVESVDDVHRLLSRLEDGTQILLSVVRDQQKREIHINPQRMER